uniref:WAP domain-containing protein n=2 Tax=Branchiostoma floridae TaxID=7739 RepID=C3Y2G6_BRAFL|eukprot:XP_002609511.1 hypothetical protein BRAFLDRAFT_95604 [Branchiostoma floridae]
MLRSCVLVLLFGLLLGVSGLGDRDLGEGGLGGFLDELSPDELSDITERVMAASAGMGGDRGGMGGDRDGDRGDGMGGDMRGDRDGDGWGDMMGDMMGEMGDYLDMWRSALGMMAGAAGSGRGDRGGNAPAWRTQCPLGGIYAPYACESDPCEGAVCAGQPADEVHCVPDYCGARCAPVFYNKTGRGERVKCDGEEQGECPAVPYGYMGHCAHNCSSDDDCKAGQKCCSNGCGMQCMRAKFEADEDVKTCKLVLGEQDEEGNQELWLFRPDQRGGMLYSTDARGNGSTFAKFSGTRQEMAQEISEQAAEAQTAIRVQSTAAGSPFVEWKVEEDKIYRGEVDTTGETVWRVVALCNCKGCHMRDRQDGYGQNGGYGPVGGMDGDDGRGKPNDQGPGGQGGQPGSDGSRPTGGSHGQRPTGSGKLPTRPPHDGQRPTPPTGGWQRPGPNERTGPIPI